MTLEEALPLVRGLSTGDKLRLIDELARLLLAERELDKQSSTPPGPPDVANEPRWVEWVDGMLDSAAARISATQHEMRAQGIVDATGNLLSTNLPADMRPGSKTSITTG